MGKTFVEKFLSAERGAIVFRKPDIVLSHDNTASIKNTFTKMGGTELANPEQPLVVLDHNAPPTNAKWTDLKTFVTMTKLEREND